MQSAERILDPKKLKLIDEYFEEQQSKFLLFFKPRKLYPAKEFIKLNDRCKYLVTQAENDPEKQFLIGSCLIEGKDHFPQNVDLGIIYLEKSIQGKFIESTIYISNMLIEGNIISKDLKKAKEYLLKHFKSEDHRIFSLYSRILFEENNHNDSLKNVQMPQCTNMNESIFKVIVIGGSAVGKTSICKRYDNKKFNPVEMATIGVNYYAKYINFRGYNIKLQVWDTSGLERFYSVVKSHFKNTNCAVVVMDAVDLGSSKESIRYFKDLIEEVGPIPVSFVLNKCDLIDTVNESLKKELQELQKNYDFRYFEISAKNDNNIDEVFRCIATEAFNRRFPESRYH